MIQSKFHDNFRLPNLRVEQPSFLRQDEARRDLRQLLVWKFLFRRRARKARKFFFFPKKFSCFPLVMPIRLARSMKRLFTILSCVNKGILRRSSPGLGFKLRILETAFVNQVKAGRGSGDEDEIARVGALESAKRVQRRAGCSLSRSSIAISIALIISEV